MSENRMYLSGQFSGETCVCAFDSLMDEMRVYDHTGGEFTHIGTLTLAQAADILRNEFRPDKDPDADENERLFVERCKEEIIVGS